MRHACQMSHGEFCVGYYFSSHKWWWSITVLSIKVWSSTNHIQVFMLISINWNEKIYRAADEFSIRLLRLKIRLKWIHREIIIIIIGAQLLWANRTKTSTKSNSIWKSDCGVIPRKTIHNARISAEVQQNRWQQKKLKGSTKTPIYSSVSLCHCFQHFTLYAAHKLFLRSRNLQKCAKNPSSFRQKKDKIQSPIKILRLDNN